jgi:hypothetical protein
MKAAGGSSQGTFQTFGAPGLSRWSQWDVSHLMKECGGNVHDRDVVAVTDAFCGPDPPKNAADLRDESFIRVGPMSDSSEPLWICYDFKNRRIFPTSCSITTWLQHDWNGSEVIPLQYAVAILLRNSGSGYWHTVAHGLGERWCERQVCQAI